MQKTTWIGRGEDAQVRVDDNAMSKVHGQIQFREGDFYLSDMQSLNGVYLNQNKINEEVKLKPGNMIRMVKQ